MIPTRAAQTGFLTLIFFALLVTAGCEESVDAVLDADQSFTLYGFLNPRADTQAVRVFPVEPVLRGGRPEPLDAVVRSTDLVTGESVVWMDSVVAYADGSFGNVAFAPLRVSHGHTYRLEVDGSDGAHARVDVVVPEEVEQVRLEPFTRRLPTRTEAAPYLPVFWGGDVRLLKVEAVYTFEVLNFGRDSLHVPYVDRLQQDDGGWRVEIDLARDQETIRTEMLRKGFLQDQNGHIEFNFMHLAVMVANTAWAPPGGVFDPNVLVEPGIWTNVDNGFGFVGGGYEEELMLFPTPCFQQLAGFYVPEGNACR